MKNKKRKPIKQSDRDIDGILKRAQIPAELFTDLKLLAVEVFEKIGSRAIKK
jgi:hypothetical protein